MASHSTQLNTDQIQDGSSYNSVDYAWFATWFENLLGHLSELQNAITLIEQNMQAAASSPEQITTREYYSVPEFAALVGRGEYTVREWCSLERVNAEKSEAGRGDAKSWKIPVEELKRYRDHGLLSKHLH